MNVHEFQAKELLQKYNLPIPEFRVVSNQADIEQAIDSLGITEGVVKVQVHAGGRGKAGGVKLAKSRQELIKQTKALLGMKLVSKQTGPEGIICHQVMITTLSAIAKEYYLGVVVDREHAVPLLMVSPQGGMEIEEVAERDPHAILKIPLDLDGTIHDKDLQKVSDFMGWVGDTATQGKELVRTVCKAFVELDGSILEVNPLVEDPDGNLSILDAKFAIDDNALFRHPHIAAMYDPTQESPQEAIAHEMDLAYIALHGTIGCMVNGAGLAMATMDLIKHHGASPANFLDVGGGATQEKVAKSFALILSDKNVKAILVNIFGGIMRCDVIAEGIIAAAKELNVHVPLVVRLEGTNVEEGKRLLAKSGLKIITANDLTDAAQKVVKEVKHGHSH